MGDYKKREVGSFFKFKLNIYLELFAIKLCLEGNFIFQIKNLLSNINNHSKSSSNKQNNDTIKFTSHIKALIFSGEFQFIVLIILLLSIVYSSFPKQLTTFVLCCNNFNVLRQLILPIGFGAIGGYAAVIMGSLDDNFTNRDHIRKKFTFIGGIAGFAAVNLLNPSGSVSQVMILALIAGLSGVSYLKRSALVESAHEDSILKAAKATLLTKNNKTIEQPVSGGIKDTAEMLLNRQKYLDQLRKKKDNKESD